MSEYIMLKSDEVEALINILEILYLKCYDEEVECMYEDMQTLRKLRDKLNIFNEELNIFNEEES